MATGAVNDLEDLTGELDAAEESLASIKFEFAGGTFSFTAVAISNVSVSFGGASTSGPSIAIEQGTMIYNNGIDGKGGALLNFGYLGVDNIVAQNAVFSGSVAVTGGISANGSTVVTAKDLKGIAESIDQAFKSLAEALTKMCGAIKTAIEGVRKALETSNAAINKANDAISKANKAINKANKAIKAVDEIARKAFCEVSLNKANGATDGSVALNLTFTNKDGETVDKSGIFSAASSTHGHTLSGSISDTTLSLKTASVVSNASKIDIPGVVSVNYLKSYTYDKTTIDSKIDTTVKNLQAQISQLGSSLSSLSGRVANIKSCTCSSDSSGGSAV